MKISAKATSALKDLTEFLYPVRDTVLGKARLAPGETVLDVDTGDGLVAFGALEQFGPAGRVIFSDISQDLVDHCRAAASAEGLLNRCRFVLAPADDLAAVPDASVDVVTTGSVLIYVKDKAQAMRELYRVLRPAGRVSLFEPINVLMSPADLDLFLGYDVTPVRTLAARVRRSMSPYSRQALTPWSISMTAISSAMRKTPDSPGSTSNFRSAWKPPRNLCPGSCLYARQATRWSQLWPKP